MGAKYPNARRFKIHRCYGISDIARKAGIHKHTVRRWEKHGLAAIDDARPKMFHGTELRRFLGERREGSRHPCRPGQMFCFRCREPRAPAGGEADLLPRTATLADLCGICECGTIMYRRVSHRTNRPPSRKLTGSIPQAAPRLADSPLASVNADLIEIWRPYAKAQCEK